MNLRYTQINTVNSFPKVCYQRCFGKHNTGSIIQNAALTSQRSYRKSTRASIQK